MKKISRAGRHLLPWIAVIFLWGVAAIIAEDAADLPVFRAARTASIAKQLLGDSTLAIAERSFFKADTFYHGGREHQLDKGFTDDFFQRLLVKLKPSGHVHLHGDQIKDVLAWMRFAMMLDPQNSEFVMATSYWLGRELKRPDLALQVIEEGLVDNPQSYVLNMGKGKFYAKGGDRVRARKAYERALKLWPGTSSHSDDTARMNMREILTAVEVLCELDGDANTAISYLKMITDLFPDKSGMFRKRMEALVAGEEPAEPAAWRWNSLRRADYEHFCNETTDGGHSEHDNCEDEDCDQDH